MKILIGCEFSGVVREAFRSRGHDSWSNDLLPAADNSPFHIQGDVFEAIERGWDMAIFHPPCTFLCSSGLHWNSRVPERHWKTDEAVTFVHQLLDCGVPKIALENPIGCISTRIRKPDQIIHPHQFGHDASKATCLWLDGLEPLVGTCNVPPIYGCSCGARFPLELGKYGCPNCFGEGKARWIWGNQTPTGQNKLGPSKDRWALRAETFPGIADAMAEQWGKR